MALERFIVNESQIPVSVALHNGTNIDLKPGQELNLGELTEKEENYYKQLVLFKIFLRSKVQKEIKNLNEESPEVVNEPPVEDETESPPEESESEVQELTEEVSEVAVTEPTPSITLEEVEAKYSSMSKAQLQKELKNLNIETTGRETKAQLLEKLVR